MCDLAESLMPQKHINMLFDALNCETLSKSMIDQLLELMTSGNRWELDKALSTIFIHIKCILKYHYDSAVDQAS